MSYRYLEDWTFADVAFEAKGKTLEELFQSALDATLNIMVSDLSLIEPQESIQEHLTAESEAELLHEFLEKIVYHKDADQLMLKMNQISINRTNGKYHLDADLWGEKLDPKKHELVTDVKAITHHRFSVTHEKSEWRATVVLDV